VKPEMLKTPPACGTSPSAASDHASTDVPDVSAEPSLASVITLSQIKH